MKLFNRYSCLLFVSISLCTTLAHAKQNNELTIVNHFDKPLHFTVTINHDVLPDFPVLLAVDSLVTSKVIDMQKEAYIATKDNEGNSGFWGVDIENNQPHIYGYRSQGIAYSWNTQTIVFCTPEEYKKKGSCL